MSTRTRVPSTTSNDTVMLAGVGAAVITAVVRIMQTQHGVSKWVLAYTAAALGIQVAQALPDPKAFVKAYPAFAGFSFAMVPFVPLVIGAGIWGGVERGLKRLLHV